MRILQDNIGKRIGQINCECEFGGICDELNKPIKIGKQEAVTLVSNKLRSPRVSDGLNFITIFIVFIFSFLKKFKISRDNIYKFLIL